MKVFPVIRYDGLFDEEIFCVCATRADAQEMVMSLAMEATYEAYLYEMETYGFYPDASDEDCDFDDFEDEIGYDMGDPIEFL